MASIDIEPKQYAGPRQDRLGLGFFVFHLAISFYVLIGWAAPSVDALGFYLVLLPLMALQWRLNQGSCVINNIESWLRTGHWRDPAGSEEGSFVTMICDWLIQSRPKAETVDAVCYGTVLVLWLAGLGHAYLLAA